MSSPTTSHPAARRSSRGSSRAPHHPSTPADPLRKTTTACKRCREQKIKCSGDRPKCRNCSRGGHGCMYVEAGPRIYVPETYVRDLEARVKAYEDATRPRSPDPGGSGAARGSSNFSEARRSSPGYAGGTDEADGGDDVPFLLEELPRLVMTQNGVPKYEDVGDISSSQSLARNLIKSFRSEDSALDIEIRGLPYNPAAWPARRPSLTRLPQLPPYNVAKRLFSVQYLYIGTIFSFVEPTLFENRLQQAYSRTLDIADREACLGYCEVLLVLAYGQMYSVNEWSGPDGPPGFEYFMQALQLLPDIHEEGSVLFVEVLSLVGYFMQNLNRRDAAFLYIGLALRMAISLGLHREISEPSLDIVAREHRRRLWWSVYSMDRILCAKSGNPITITDEDIGVFPPSRLPGIEEEICPATVLLHYTELSRILGKISESIYRKSRKTGLTLIASVQSIMSDLSSWYRGFPPALRFDFSRADQQINREAVSIFLHYYQCINMTARPLLFHVVKKRLENREVEKRTDWKHGLSEPTIAVIEACISASRDSTTMLHYAAKQNLVATYGYMDGEHAFSAAIVLVMVNIAFPVNDRDNAAMDMALGVLRWMADKGNSHIQARHQFLLNLRSRIPSESTTTPDTSASIIPPHVSTHANNTSNAFVPLTLTNNSDIDTTVPFPESTNPSLDHMLRFETTSGDAGLWEEGYRNFDINVVNMDFDWTQLTDPATALDIYSTMPGSERDFHNAT